MVRAIMYMNVSGQTKADVLVTDDQTDDQL